jgi:peptidoglycan/xylan/chitin deacetylase (PgdA/CDA1 family)
MRIMVNARVMGRALLVSAAAATLLFGSGEIAAQRSARAMALTFDDLPYVAGGQPDTVAAAERVTTGLLRVLASHHAPVVGFVNEGKLQVDGERDARIALLERWVAQGAMLGNHTYSHVDLNTVQADDFEQEILKGEVVSRRLMKRREPYRLFFRHPQTHTGDTQAKKDAIQQFLSARGYTVAPHTIETADFIFNVGYVRSVRGGDHAMAGRLRSAYVDFALAASAFAEQAASKIFGRDVPQTILLHANDLNADTLDELLGKLENRGYRFIALDDAMKDPAYQTRDTLVTKYGPTWLWRWMKSKGQNVSFADDPEPPQWVLDLYRRPRARQPPAAGS